jgi:hypothetical protein
MNTQNLIWCNVQNAAYTITNRVNIKDVEVVFLEPVLQINKPKMQFTKEFFHQIVRSKSLEQISFTDATIKIKNLALVKRSTQY